MHIDPGYIRVLSPTNSNNNSQPEEGKLLNASVQDLTSKQVVQGLTATSSEFENTKDESTDEAQGLSATNADKVSLSEEAKEKQAEEAAASGAQGGGSPADIVIAKLKERIEQVKKQLEALAGKEGVEEQEKMLQDELSILNAALLEAMNEKLQAERAG